MSDRNWQKALELVPALGKAIDHARQVQQTTGEAREDAISNLVVSLVEIAERFAEKDLVDNAQVKAFVDAALDLRPAASPDSPA